MKFFSVGFCLYFMSCSSIFCSFGDLVIDSAGLQHLYLIDCFGFYSVHVSAIFQPCSNGGLQHSGLRLARSTSFEQEGSLSGHTCRDMGTRFLQSHPNSLVISLQGKLRTNSYPDPHTVTNSRNVCWSE